MLLHPRPKNLWFSTKAFPTITWQRMYATHVIFLFDSFMSQSIVSMRNYHITDAAITVLVCSQLKVTRSGAMKQSEVTHIVMQWWGFFFFYLWLSLSFYPFCLLYFNFYFHYHLPAPSVSCMVGEDVCRCPGGEGGEINSEGVWSFLKDFPGKTVLSGW